MALKRRSIFALVAASLFCCPAVAMDLCGAGKRVTCVVDGDTFWWHGEKVRILELDAPEISEPACDAELAAGIKAQGALLDLINHGKVRLKRDGLDLYGRTLAKVSVDGHDVAEAMTAAGVARPYADRAIGWCP